MLGELSGVAKIFIITGRTDMRKSFDGLMAIIRDTYQLDPYANALYLFCGRDSRKLKALHYDKDGFVLYQKRLDENGRFQWPRNASEARLLTRQEFRCANYAQTECQFRYCGTAIPFLTVRSTAR